MAITITIVSILGFLLLGFGIIKHSFSYSDDPNRKIFMIITILGFVLFASSLGGKYFLDKNQNGIIKNEIAQELGTDPDEVIVEELDKSLFSFNSNDNIRKVYYNNDSYIVELDNGHLKNISKQ